MVDHNHFAFIIPAQGSTFYVSSLRESIAEGRDISARILLHLIKSAESAL